MENKNDGGPAFAGWKQPEEVEGSMGYPVHLTERNPGMSLRDWFAGMAIVGRASVMSQGVLKGKDLWVDETVENAFLLADAMIKERGK